MSEQTLTPNVTEPQVDSRTELMQAFETKSKQENGSPAQDGGGVDPGPSQTGDPADPSRPGPSREELLNSLTADEIEKIPALRSRIQSRVDSQVAGRSKTLEQEIRSRVTTEVALSSWKERFDSLDADDLGALLKESPEARSAFSQIQTAPAPPSPEEIVAASTFEYYRSVIRTVMDRAQDAKLEDDFIAEHDPQVYFEAHKADGLAPNELLLQWQNSIDAKIIDTKVTNAGKPTVDDEAKRLEDRANNLNTRAGADMSGTGLRVAPTEDFMNVRSEVGLANAFARKGAK